jgi:hypothetical protein
MATEAADLRLRWVAADPARERGVDALGMGAQADRIADRLLPDLSVATTRARYFSFLCWAVKKSQGTTTPDVVMHRLEAELAIEEAMGHRRDPVGSCPDVIGRQRAASYLDQNDNKPPARPERLYKSTAFAAYRPAMRAFGLLTRKQRPELTDGGHRLALAFQDARGHKPRCLGDVSVHERSRIRVLLGLDYRKQDDLTASSARRRATYEAVGDVIGDSAGASILEHHAQRPTKPGTVAWDLHRAFVWELLSCGLLLGFTMVLANDHVDGVLDALRDGLRGAPRRPGLGAFDGQDPDAGQRVVALLKAATKLRPSQLGLDEGPLRLAEVLVRERDPRRFVREMVERHRLVKPDAPWIALRGDQVQPLAPKKMLNFGVRARSYRMFAFKQLLTDLEMLS